LYASANYGMIDIYRIYTWTTLEDVEYLILYAKRGQEGETALSFGSLSPNSSVNAISNDPNLSQTFSNGILTLNYVLDGLKVVNITLPSSSTTKNATLRILLMDRDTAGAWHAPVLTGVGNWGNYFSIGSNTSIFVGGPYLVRDASIKGSILSIVSTRQLSIDLR
jgi:hypothetical protein